MFLQGVCSLQGVGGYQGGWLQHVANRRTEEVMKKMLAGPMIVGLCLLGTATVVDALEAQTAPPVDASVIDDDGADDDASSKIGLLGLVGLLGLAGLAGVKRRDPVVRYDNRSTPPR